MSIHALSKYILSVYSLLVLCPFSSCVSCFAIMNKICFTSFSLCQTSILCLLLPVTNVFWTGICSIQWIFVQHYGYWWPCGLATEYQCPSCWVCTHAFQSFYNLRGYLFSSNILRYTVTAEPQYRTTSLDNQITYNIWHNCERQRKRYKHNDVSHKNRVRQFDARDPNPSENMTPVTPSPGEHRSCCCKTVHSILVV